MKKIGAVVWLSVFVLTLVTSCVTHTRVSFNTDVPGADVYVDGEYIGKTPATTRMSNAVWDDPDILIRKDGYKDIHTGTKKEIKAVNLIFGLFFWLPSLLWVQGPLSHQYYMLTPENNNLNT